MHLSHQELRSLARFLAKRFPSPDAISPIARSARLHFDPTGPDDAEADWFSLLATAHSQGRLRALVRAATDACPEDENLIELQAILAPPRTRELGIAVASSVIALAAVALLGVGLLSWGLSGDEAVAAEPIEVVAPVEIAQVAPAVEVPEVAPAQAPELAPKDEVEAMPAPAPSGTAEAEVPTPCTPSADQGIVGWWYAGERSPGAAGEQVIVPRTLNVRAEFPSFRNDYDVRTPVQCILLEGTPLTLHAEPERVPPGHYWVPLTAADLP